MVFSGFQDNIDLLNNIDKIGYVAVDRFDRKTSMAARRR